MNNSSGLERELQNMASTAGRSEQEVEREARMGGSLLRRHQATHCESLLAWGQRFLPAHFALPPSAMHRWLDEQCTAMTRTRGLKLNVIGPRGAAKSTLATLAFPLKMALEGREPYIWLVSDSRTQAHAHLENIQAELLENPRLARAYPAAVGRGPVWRAGRLVLNNGAVIEAFGTGQRLRGRRRREHRPSLIVCDDLQSDQHVNSPLARQHARDWFQGTLLKAGTRGTHVVNLATALHREALAMELHATPGWVSRLFPAIVQWPHDMPLWEEWEAIYCRLDDPDAAAHAREFYERNAAAMQHGAELLWPEHEDLYSLMCMRVEAGRAAFEREKQGSPVNPDLCEWPETYFHGGIWFDLWPTNLRVRTLALDPSKGADARRGDYSAYVLLGIDAAGIVYIEADLARRPAPQMTADGVSLYRRFRPDAFGVEANQFQDLLAESFAEEFRRQGVFGVRPWLLDNRVNKLVRIRRLAPLLAAERMRFKDNSPGTKLLVNQLRDFPLADHDDGPDALEMALRLATELLDQGPSERIAGRIS